ncbi:MAG: tripartite tricarboxylate transporter substrate binding protein [Proteobacteria bacterium]|nr:tripartite tricarboxylate transporter substrate binding protein [Burkholderiales bacterium]
MFHCHACSLPTLRALLTALSLFCTAGAHAQQFPVKPIRMIVPFAPGGGTDIIGRQFAARLSESLGQTVAVDNRAGAGGNVGAEIAAKSAPDGYTVMFTTNSIAVNVSLYPKLNYNLFADLQPVAFLASAPLTLVTHPLVPVKTAKELAALSKKRKGGLNFGSNGTGTTSHLSGELFKITAGVDLTHIPFKGAGAVIASLLGGEVDMGFVASISALPHIRSGKLRVLAVTTPREAAALPGVPTMGSSFPGFDTDIWYGSWLPTGTAKPVTDRWVDELRKVHAHPDVRAAFDRDGAEAIFMPPAEFTAYLKKEVAKYALLVKQSGARPD